MKSTNETSMFKVHSTVKEDYCVYIFSSHLPENSVLSLERQKGESSMEDIMAVYCNIYAEKEWGQNEEFLELNQAYI
jgi:hypothetical protein